MATRRSNQDEALDLAGSPAAAPTNGAVAAPSGWEAWEGKGSLLLHMDLVSDIVVHTLTLAHYMHVWFLHGLTFQVKSCTHTLLFGTILRECMQISVVLTRLTQHG
jgi:hypothetical protein